MGTQKSRAPGEGRHESENIHRPYINAAGGACPAGHRLDVLGLALLVAVVWVAAGVLWSGVFR